MIVLTVLATCSSASAAIVTREYLLGDIDGIHYDGPGSVDHIFVDPDLNQQSLPFDNVAANQDIPFTFLFPVAAGEEVIGALLTVGLRATDSLVTDDWLVVHSDDVTEPWTPAHPDVYEFLSLGWLPIPSTGTTVRSVDLADILGDNRLPFLQDGQLDIHISDDTAVDYAKLTLTVHVIPEPATIIWAFLSSLSLAGYPRRRQG